MGHVMVSAQVEGEGAEGYETFELAVYEDASFEVDDHGMLTVTPVLGSIYYHPEPHGMTVLLPIKAREVSDAPKPE